VTALPHTRTILKGTTSYFASGVINSAGTFLISLLISWHLGKEGLGLFSICLTVVLIGVLLSELGLNPFILREFAAGRQSPLLSLRSILLLRLAASCIAALILFVGAIAFFPSTDLKALTGLAGILIITRSLGSALENFIKAQLRHVTFLVLTATNLALSGGVVYLLLYAGHGITSVLLALAALDVVKVGFLLYHSRDPLTTLIGHWETPRDRLRPILSQCIPFAMIGVLSMLSERADVLLLAAFRGPGEAGLYTAADRFLIIASLVDSSLFASTFPILSTLSNHEHHSRLTRRLVTITLVMAVFITVVLYVVAPFLIGATFRFSESVLLLRILSLGLPAMIANRVMRTALYSLHKERAVAVTYGVSFLGNLTLNLLFIPQFGAVAAAVICIVTEYCITIVYIFLYLRKSVVQRSGETTLDYDPGVESIG
jgi:O-antigen/teichoic acid export membrane protein